MLLGVPRYLLVYKKSLKSRSYITLCAHTSSFESAKNYFDDFIKKSGVIPITIQEVNDVYSYTL